MPHEVTASEDHPLGREEWITKFVNAVVCEFRRGLDRMIVVAAARNAWPKMRSADPYETAQEWATKDAGE